MPQRVLTTCVLALGVVGGGQAQKPAGNAAERAPSSSVAEARTHFERGQRAYAAGKLEDARAAFEHAYALAPSKELSFNLGRVHERLGQSAEAIAHYERYLAQAPPDAPDRAEVRQRLRALRASGRQLRESLKQPPPSTEALQAEARRFFKRGMRLFARGRYRGALAAFTAAHSLSKIPELYYNLALTSERLGARRDATDYYRAYLAARPQAPDRETVEASIRQLRAASRQ